MTTTTVPDWETSEMRELYQAFLKIKTPEECSRFLRDLCTLSELNAIAERWQVAKLIAQEIPYREIHKRTGVSTATVTRVAHWYHHGEGGYRAMLKKIK